MYRLVGWLFRFLRRKVGLRGLVALFLLWAAMITVTTSLARFIRGMDDEEAWVGRLVFIALCLGWGLGKRRIPLWLSNLYAGLLGAGVQFIYKAELGPTIFPLINSALFYIRTTLSEEMPLLPAIESLRFTWAGFSNAAATLVVPLQSWLMGFLRGDPPYERLVAHLFWGWLIWMLGFWASSSLRHHDQPVRALLPAGVVLAGSFSFARQENFIGLAAFIGITLLLIGVNHQYLRERFWRTENLDYAEDIRLEALIAVGSAAILLTLLAAFAPHFSYRQMVEWFESATRRTGGPPASSLIEPELGRSLGFVVPTPRPGPVEQAISAGLPRAHLLGSGPELSDEIVMTIRVTDPAADLSPDYYWRSLTYDTYTGQGWATSETATAAYREGVAAFDPGELAGRIVRQQVSLAEPPGNFMFAAGEIVTVDWPFSVVWRDPADAGLRADQFGGLLSQDDYQVDSLYPLPSIELLRGTNGMPSPAWVVETYLDLPAGIPQRVYDLVYGLSVARPTTYDIAVSIETYLRDIPYNLDLPAPPAARDVVDYFLFEAREGYCDYYASAMVVLARAAGLPARLAVGYASGTYDQANDRYVVTAADAHSWVEIYFPGMGWVVFEPTGGRPAIVREVSLASAPSTLETRPAAFEPVWLREVRAAGGWVLGLLGLGLLVLVGWMGWDVWRVRHLSPNEVAVTLFGRLHPVGERLAIPARSGDTPYEYAEAFAARVIHLSAHQRFLAPVQNEIHTLVDFYVQAVFAPHPLTNVDRIEALRVWQTLRVRLWWVRVGMVFVRKSK